MHYYPENLLVYCRILTYCFCFLLLQCQRASSLRLCRECYTNFDRVHPGSDVWSICSQLPRLWHFITNYDFRVLSFNMLVPVLSRRCSEDYFLRRLRHPRWRTACLKSRALPAPNLLSTNRQTVYQSIIFISHRYHQIGCLRNMFKTLQSTRFGHKKYHRSGENIDKWRNYCRMRQCIFIPSSLDMFIHALLKLWFHHIPVGRIDFEIASWPDNRWCGR